MAKSKKEIFYWATVAVYGLVLFCVLLYLRFPTEKFRRYCERLIESKLPEIGCSIGGISYAFPYAIVIADLRLQRKGSGEELFLDPELTLKPDWRNILDTVHFQSRAYGGSSSATARLNKEENRLEIVDAEIKELDIQQITFLGKNLNRKISGAISGNGMVKIGLEDLAIHAAEGSVSITGGAVELKRPILELSVLDISEGEAQFAMGDKNVEFSGGSINNPMLKMQFEGNVGLTKPFPAGVISITGNLTPQNALYQKNRQLKVIVTRMQKRYKNSTLPFKVGGNIGRPTFVFGN